MTMIAPWVPYKFAAVSSHRYSTVSKSGFLGLKKAGIIIVLNPHPNSPTIVENKLKKRGFASIPIPNLFSLFNNSYWFLFLN